MIIENLWKYLLLSSLLAFVTTFFAYIYLFNFYENATAIRNKLLRKNMQILVSLCSGICISLTISLIFLLGSIFDLSSIFLLFIILTTVVWTISAYMGGNAAIHVMNMMR